MSKSAAGDPPSVRDPWLFTGLCLLTVVTGMVDATSFLGLGEVFTANMTGNVLLLGFAATGSSAVNINHLSFTGTLVALGTFVAGAVAGGAVAGRRGRPPRLGAGFALEWLVLLGAVATLVGRQPYGDVRYGAVALLGLSMGVQNAVVRRMGLPDVNTTVLTTTLGGLAADVVEIGGRPTNAGRRIATITFIFIGAIIGGVLERHGAQWSSTGAVVVMTVAWVALGLSGALRAIA
jgi:uncharacterized membrane protein YoaK (UPF0700 family)